MKLGILYASAAYVIWGLFPMYFKTLQTIPATQIVLHRIVWSFAFLMLVLAWRRQWAWIASAVKQPKVLAGFGASALLLSVNWFVYVWAVNHERVVDASLGYFINPLVNVLFGFVLLRERLRFGQWMAIALAAVGVAWLTWHAGQLPWIGLTLAATFGTYGLLRKVGALGALEGQSLETAILFPLAFIALAVLTLQGDNAFLQAPPDVQWWLIAAGPITAIPLLLFAAGARRIPLSLLGILQYVGPSLQLLLGVWLYHEPFGGARLVGFVFIWAALAIYSLESVWQAWSARVSPPA